MGVLALGIESTAHTFGIGIVDENGKILSNEKAVYKPEIGKGIVPREAAEHHVKKALSVLKESLEKSGVSLKDISAIAFSQGAGLPPCLYVGASLARFLSLKYKKPLIPVCHQIAHIEIGKLCTGAKDPVVVYLSGGNTQILALVEKRYRVFGETMDIALGNALDVLAREIGLSMPGGPEVERLAKKGKWIELPYVVKGMDVSFTGILTEAIRKLKTHKPEDVCFSMQEVCFSMLTEVAERALAHLGKKEILLVGGVASNKRLQEMMKTMCEDRGAKFYVVPPEYSSDNGAMIAWVGVLMHKSGIETNIEKSRINQKLRTDDVEVVWC